MDDLQFWLRGWVIGFAIAAPVGPIGLLCIQRTLAHGPIYGLVSGLGAATADAVYGTIAGFGLTAISTFLLGASGWLGWIGGLFLCYLGVRTFLSQPATQAAGAQRATGPWMAFVSIFALTLTNPMTILSFMAIFAGVGLAQVNTDAANYAAAFWLVVGVFCGSASWWLLLSGGVSLLRSRLNAVALRWVNRLAGVVIVGFGLWLLVGKML